MSALGARDALAAIPGAPEARLPATGLAVLPLTTPAPPWLCRVEAVVWWHRAPTAAQEALPRRLRGVHHPLVVGAAVRYLASPVGPYEELVAGVLCGPLTVHVPFLAVDSAASLQGGREHWSLPKTLAAFVREDGGVVASGAGWGVSVRGAPAGLRLPVAGLLRGRQVDAAGTLVRSTSTVLGRGRPARVAVQVDTDSGDEPGSIGRWLRSGRHPGAVLAGRLRVAGG